MQSLPVPECLACGACCFGEGDRYVPVRGDDHARLGDRAEELTTFVGNRCFMRMHEGHCAALELRSDGRYFCGVYELRPDVCRALERGSPSCEAEFVQKRERAVRALPVLREVAGVVGARPIMRSRRLARCATCGLNDRLCVCAALPRIATRVRVRVVAHRGERFKSTNTGRLAVRMLEGASYECRSERVAEQGVADARSWVLFPSDEAVPLQDAMALGLETLIVPDGTWNQAKRLARRDPACVGARHVRLDGELTSGYGLRRNARPNGLCTLEAIAEALRVLEGEATAQLMLAAFQRWVERAKQVRAGAHDAVLLGV